MYCVRVLYQVFHCTCTYVYIHTCTTAANGEQDKSPADETDMADTNGGQDQEEAVPEKLADDDDGLKDPLWKRVLFTVFPKLKRGQTCIEYCT